MSSILKAMEESSGNKRIGLAAMFVLLAITVTATLKYEEIKNRYAVSEGLLASYRYNEKALLFLRLFVEKVLEAEREVSFEDRLQLETQVRELKDPEVTSAWNSFAKAKTESQAQTAVKTLLKLLTDKIRIR